MADFAVAVQNDGVKLGDLMRETSQWVHYWKEGITSFDDTARRGDKRGREESAEASESVIARTMKNTKTLVRHLQSRVDSLARSSGSGGNGNANRDNNRDDRGNGSDRNNGNARTVTAGNGKGKGNGRARNNRANARDRRNNNRNNRGNGGNGGGNSNNGGNAA